MPRHAVANVAAGVRGGGKGTIHAGTAVARRECAAEGGGQSSRWYVRPALSGRV